MFYTPQFVIGEDRGGSQKGHAYDSNLKHANVHAHNFNGLHYGEENVHIHGRKLFGEQNHGNLEIYLVA